MTRMWLLACNETMMKVAVHQLFDDIKQSKDKLFFIKHQAKSTSQERWFLVQVDMEESDPIVERQLGVYRVRWWIRHASNSKECLQCNCRYWLEIHEMANRELGAIMVIQPQQVEQLLTEQANHYAWYQLDVNLAENAITGPFDFTPVGNENHHIAQAQWQGMQTQARILQVDVHDVFQVVALT